MAPPNREHWDMSYKHMEPLYQPVLIVFVGVQFFAWLMLEILERKCGMSPAIRRSTSFGKLDDLEAARTKARMSKRLDKKGRFRIQTRGSVYFVKSVWVFSGCIYLIFCILAYPNWFVQHFYYLNPYTVNLPIYPILCSLIAAFYSFEMATNRYAKLQWSIVAHHWISTFASTACALGLYSPLLSWYGLSGVFAAGGPPMFALGVRAQFAHNHKNMTRYTLKCAAYWYIIFVFIIFGGIALILLNLWLNDGYNEPLEYFSFSVTVLAALAFGYDDILTSRAMFELARMDYTHAFIEARPKTPSQFLSPNMRFMLENVDNADDMGDRGQGFLFDDVTDQDQVVREGTVIMADDGYDDDGELPSHLEYDDGDSEYELEAWPIDARHINMLTGLSSNLQMDMFMNESQQTIDPQDELDIVYVSQMAAMSASVYSTSNLQYAQRRQSGQIAHQSSILDMMGNADSMNRLASYPVTSNNANNGNDTVSKMQQIPRSSPNLNLRVSTEDGQEVDIIRKTKSLDVPPEPSQSRVNNVGNSGGRRSGSVSISHTNASTFIPMKNAIQYFQNKSINKDVRASGSYENRRHTQTIAEDQEMTPKKAPLTQHNKMGSIPDNSRLLSMESNASYLEPIPNLSHFPYSDQQQRNSDSSKILRTIFAEVYEANDRNYEDPSMMDDNTILRRNTSQMEEQSITQYYNNQSQRNLQQLPQHTIIEMISSNNSVLHKQTTDTTNSNSMHTPVPSSHTTLAASKKDSYILDTQTVSERGKRVMIRESPSTFAGGDITPISPVMDNDENIGNVENVAKSPEMRRELPDFKNMKTIRSDFEDDGYMNDINELKEELRNEVARVDAPSDFETSSESSQVVLPDLNDLDADISPSPVSPISPMIKSKTVPNRQLKKRNSEPTRKSVLLTNMGKQMAIEANQALRERNGSEPPPDRDHVQRLQGSNVQSSINILPPRAARRSKSKSRNSASRSKRLKYGNNIGYVNGLHSAEPLGTSKSMYSLNNVDPKLMQGASVRNLNVNAGKRRESFHVSSATQPQITFRTPIHPMHLETIHSNAPPNTKNLGFVQVNDEITGNVKQVLLLRKIKSKRKRINFKDVQSANPLMSAKSQGTAVISQNGTVRMRRQVRPKSVRNLKLHGGTSVGNNGNNGNNDDLMGDDEFQKRMKAYPNYAKRISQHRRYGSDVKMVDRARTLPNRGLHNVASNAPITTTSTQRLHAEKIKQMDMENLIRNKTEGDGNTKIKKNWRKVMFKVLDGIFSPDGRFETDGRYVDMGVEFPKT